MKKLIILALVAAVSASLQAQEFRATIMGRVSDPSGAAIPGAQITAINVETNAATRTASTETGDYTLPFLPPGNYRLVVEHAGFKKLIREGITLRVQDRVSIDIRLELGEVAESINVSAEAPLLEMSTASRGEVIMGRTLVDLPLNGRNAFALAALAPGVNTTVRGQASTFLRTTANSGISGVTLSGGQPRFNEALLDGVPITGSDGLIQFVPSVDATQEFKVQTNSFDAEFGRFTGGVINASIRSGTNELHGALFEFLRNSAWNARDPFDFGSKIPQFGYNLFGGSLGGPVIVPKVYKGKDRTFFFFNYEGSREGVPRAFVSTVPTALQQRGDFTETRVRLSGGQGAPVVIYDPASTRREGNSYVRDPFPGNRIPDGRINQISRNLINLFPAPNAAGDSITSANNYLLSFKDPVLDNGYVAKIDHRFNDRHSIFGRYSWRHFRVVRQGAFKNQVTGDAEDRFAPGFAFDDTYTLNPTTVLNFRYGFTRILIKSAADNLGYNPAQLGFPAALARSLPVQAIPQVSIGGYTTLSGTSKLNRSPEDGHTVRASATKMRGRQTLRWGGEYRVLRSYSGGLGAGAGTYSFDSVFTRGPNPQAATLTGGSSLASFLLGLGSSGSVANNAVTAEQAPYYGLYFQDDIRLTSKLTVNLGLRYEWEGGNTERFNRFNRGFAFSVASPLEAQARMNYAASPIAELPAAQFNVKGGLLFAGVAGQPRAITNIDRNNISPRIGFAYSLTGRTVLRGGYGLFYGPTTLLDETRLGFSVSTPWVATIDGGLTPVNTLSNPFPDGLLEPPGAKDGLLSLVGQGISFVDVGRQQPYTHQYQFSIQRELPWQVLVDAAYVGSSGRDLPVNQQIDGIPEQFRAQARDTFAASGRNILNDSVTNPFFGLISSGALSGRTTSRGQLLRPFPQFTTISELNRSLGSSRYDSFQLKVTRRFAQGFSLIASYAAAKQLERTRFLNDQDKQPVKELSEFDVPQRLSVSTTYELPFGKGRRWLKAAGGFAGKLIEGYQLNLIYQANGGVPLTIGSAESVGRSAKLPAAERSTGRQLDVAAFRQRQTLELVATSRLPDVRSPGRNNFDISLFKTTSLSERLRVQFRAEVFNALNRPEYSSPSTSFGAANFGVITSANTFSRQIQFGLKLLW
jgi:hypothetical protein